MSDIGKIIEDSAVYLFIGIFIGVSQAAGIGGGPILNICLMLGLGYETKDSMAITYIFLIGGSVASMVSSYGKRTIDNKLFVMNYNLIIITLPMTVSGSILGAMFNHFISEFLITIAFTFLLSYLAWNSFKKYRALALSVSSQLKEKLINQNEFEMQSYCYQPPKNVRLEQILAEENEVFPKQKVKIFLQIMAYTIVLLLFKGGQNFESIIGLERCGFGSLICVLLHIGLSYLYCKSIAMKQNQLDLQKQNLGFVFENQNDKMNENFMRKAMMLGFAGGFVGGCVGIGGAIILVPAWLEMGIDKSIASSSSSPLIFSSALISGTIAFLCQFYSSFIQFVLYFILAFISSYFIKKLIVWLKQKYKLQGMIFILLMAVMVSSLLFLVPFEVRKWWLDGEAFFEFGHMC